MARPVVIAAGGTGGHFFPAEALADALVARGQRVVLMTDRRGWGLTEPGSTSVFAGRERFRLRGAGIAGRGLWRGAAALASLAAGTIEARALLARLQPGCVVAFGGYPAIAPVLAARSLRRRPAVVLHEQNAVLGRANRRLAPRADLLALGFADTRLAPTGIATSFVGNPVRPAVLAAATPYAPADAEAKIRLLVLGGSLGARVFSDVLPPALAALSAALRARLSVVQQCRDEDLERVRQAYASSGVTAELAAFFDDVGARLAAAHLVLARAGASTVAELAAAGRPSLLVPLPGAIDDHQSANAQSLARLGGARVLPQSALTATTLAEALAALLDDPDGCAAMARAAASAGRADAADALAALVEARLQAEQPA